MPLFMQRQRAELEMLFPSFLFFTTRKTKQKLSKLFNNINYKATTSSLGLRTAKIMIIILVIILIISF